VRRGGHRSPPRPTAPPSRARRPTAPQPDGVLLADPLAIRARRFRAVFVCKPPGPGFPPGGRSPSRSSRTRDRRGLARASGARLRCTRTSSTASGRSSTPRCRVPRTCSSSRGARPTRRAIRSLPRPSSRTSGCCSRTSCGTPAAPACWPT
jgi:hypothetical protein